MNSTDIRSIFLSHGSPLSCFEDTPARNFMIDLGKSLVKPKAVIAVSAHWTTRSVAVGAAIAPETIHDFYGFPDFLYQKRYPAKGAPDLAARAADLLGADLIGDQGLDHGIWTVMSLLWPNADVPVIPVSVQPKADPAHHYDLGKRLRPLVEDGVLVMGTGSATHNLRAYMSHGGGGPQPWAAAFADWLAETSAAGDVEALLDYRARAPYARENHPTDEHLLPFYTALGAAPQGKAERLHGSIEYGVISMDDYGFA
ncbi:MAG TPA: class III extradiol ring-cleavage dioxygenase [Candidatus Sulfotelmatobacter sp.]|jgi:4,5-DOPA dioxygenase extradiol|nr:class III extradiol ring-cleavage dioxygenase [Candidatus Sulfotelmatobacter sp.]